MREKVPTAGGLSIRGLGAVAPAGEPRAEPPGAGSPPPGSASSASAGSERLPHGNAPKHLYTF